MSELLLRPRFLDLLAFIAGALLTTAFAPLGWWPVAIFSLAILFWLWQQGSLGRACWRGFLFGVGMFGIGTSWVFISIHEFGHTPAPVAAILTIVFNMFLALLTPVSCAYVYRRFFHDATMASVLFSLPALWLLFEWLRSWILTGFPWLSIGYSQTDSFLRGIAPLLGIFGISYVVAVIAVLLLLIIKKKEIRVFHGSLLIIISMFALTVSDIEWGKPLGKPVRVALLQGNISQHNKWAPEQRLRTMELYRQMTLQHLDTDLIIWPETAVPAFYHNVVNDYLAEIEDMALESKTDMLIGIPVVQYREERQLYFNSMVSIGESQMFYHKQHLVPFGEYVPFGDLIRKLGGFFNLPMSDFANGGKQQPLVRVAGHAVGISICYEDAFGDEVIRTLPEASMLVNVSNDAWFGDSFAPHQHLQIARMRALETARPLLRATNTGITAFIDQQGRVIRRAPQFAEASITAEIQPMQGETPYVKTGNRVIVLFSVFILLIGALRSRQTP